MKINPDFVLRELLGEYILIPNGDAALKYGTAMMSVNEMGKVILDLLPEVDTEEELAAKVAQEYEPEEQVIRDDVHEFLCALREKEVLIP